MSIVIGGNGIPVMTPPVVQPTTLQPAVATLAIEAAVTVTPSKRGERGREAKDDSKERKFDAHEQQRGRLIELTV